MAINIYAWSSIFMKNQILHTEKEIKSHDTCRTKCRYIECDTWYTEYNHMLQCEEWNTATSIKGSENNWTIIALDF